MYQTHFMSIKNEWERFMQIVAFVLAILFLPGCGGVQTQQVPASDAPPPMTSTPTRENPRPTITLSSTATATPTWTSVPTLPVEIRKQNLIELFSTNGGCDFPCWWGISPGDPIQKVSELGLRVGKPLRRDGLNHYYTLSLDELNAPDLDVNYNVDADEIVQSMEISLAGISRFWDYHEAFEARLSPASILSRYGKPSEVLLLVVPRVEPDPTPRAYILFLIYDKQDFGIVYRGMVDSEDPLRICSIKVDDYHLQSITLYLHDPLSKLGELNRSHLAELQPLDQVTSMNLDEFQRIFSEPENNQCIEVSNDVWQ